jgi:hypothetical protein
MTAETRLEAAAGIMLDFAARTGLTSSHLARRYLWTDAFALCNFLSLYRATGETRYKDIALELVEQVHEVLARHRPDDPRTGWISGLDEATGRAHPLAGGLRIGKPLNERAPDAPPDAHLEWEQDGQYYHYLTKWMHALVQAGVALGQPRFIVWALELAQVAHRAFVYEPAAGAGKRMYWKMRIDLSAPLVASMGQHDPLDGLVTIKALEQTAMGLPEGIAAANLDREFGDLKEICSGIRFETDDPLGIGGLLFDAGRLVQIRWAGDAFMHSLTGRVLAAAGTGLAIYASQGALSWPAERRLAFRELGLAIGLSALGRLPGWLDAAGNPQAGDILAMAGTLGKYHRLGEAIEQTWLTPDNQRANSWTEHQDINTVMLATSLVPDGFLSIAEGRQLAP